MLVITTYATYEYDECTIIEPGTHEFHRFGRYGGPELINGHTGEVLELCDLTGFLRDALGIIWSYDGEIPPEGLVTVSPHWVK